MKNIASHILIWLSLIFSANALAGNIPVYFGSEEKVNHLDKVVLKGAEGEDLYIAYKTSSYYLLAGVYLLVFT
jgi:hypothetical protein